MSIVENCKRVTDIIETYSDKKRRIPIELTVDSDLKHVCLQRYDNHVSIDNVVDKVISKFRDIVKESTVDVIFCEAMLNRFSESLLESLKENKKEVEKIKTQNRNQILLAKKVCQQHEQLEEYKFKINKLQNENLKYKNQIKELHQNLEEEKSNHNKLKKSINDYVLNKDLKEQFCSNFNYDIY